MIPTIVQIIPIFHPKNQNKIYLLGLAADSGHVYVYTFPDLKWIPFKGFEE